jgi:hypothetical protein
MPACDIPRFNLSTSGWSSGDASGLIYKFVCQSASGVVTSLSDFTSADMLSGLLLPLSLADGSGTVQVAVVSRNHAGCETTLNPSVAVQISAPTMADLMGQFLPPAPSGTGAGAGSAGSGGGSSSGSGPGSDAPGTRHMS